MRSIGFLLLLLSISFPLQAQTALEMGSITYREAVADNDTTDSGGGDDSTGSNGGDAQAVSSEAKSIPTIPPWLLLPLAVALLSMGLSARKKRLAKSASFIAAVVAVLMASTSFRSAETQAQTGAYSCPQVSVPGSISITSADAGEASFNFDPSDAISLCSEYIGANYVGPGSLSMESVLTFQITNDSGVVLELDPAVFTEDAINTSIDNFPLGANTVNYQNMQVTPSDTQSDCENILDIGQSCTVTITANTVGDLTVT